MKEGLIFLAGRIKIMNQPKQGVTVQIRKGAFAVGPGRFFLIRRGHFSLLADTIVQPLLPLIGQAILLQTAVGFARDGHFNQFFSQRWFEVAFAE